MIWSAVGDDDVSVNDTDTATVTMRVSPRPGGTFRLVATFERDGKGRAVLLDHPWFGRREWAQAYAADWWKDARGKLP